MSTTTPGRQAPVHKVRFTSTSSVRFTSTSSVGVSQAASEIVYAQWESGPWTGVYGSYNEASRALLIPEDCIRKCRDRPVSLMTIIPIVDDNGVPIYSDTGRPDFDHTIAYGGFSRNTAQPVSLDDETDDNHDLTMTTGHEGFIDSEEWHIQQEVPATATTGKPAIPIYVRRLPDDRSDDRYETDVVPPGAATKEGGAFVRFCSIVQATQFIGKPDFRSGKHPIIRQIMDRDSGQVTRIVISLDENTCTLGHARGGEIVKARTTRERLWRIPVAPVQADSEDT